MSSRRTHFRRVSGHRSTCQQTFCQADRFWLDTQEVTAPQSEANIRTQHQQISFCFNVNQKLSKTRTFNWQMEALPTNIHHNNNNNNGQHSTTNVYVVSKLSFCTARYAHVQIYNQYALYCLFCHWLIYYLHLSCCCFGCYFNSSRRHYIAACSQRQPVPVHLLITTQTLLLPFPC